MPKNYFDLINSKSNIWIFYILLMLFTFGLYHNILDTYAYTDDYEFTLNASNSDFINVFIQHGRILYGLGNKLLYSSFNTIEQLKFIRAISLLGGLLLLISTFWIMLKYNCSVLLAFVTIILFCTSPTFNILIIWAVTYQVSWAMLLALLSGYLILKHGHDYKTILMSIVLGVVALNLYQPAYTLFIFPSFLYWLKEKEWKGLLKPLIIHLCTYLLYFVSFKFYLHFFDLANYERSGIEINMFKSAIWFIKEPFEQALSFHFILAPNFWMYLTRVLVFLLILFSILNFKKSIKDNLYTFAITGIFFILSMLPNVIAAEKWVSLRTMNTLTLLIIVLVVTVQFQKFLQCRKEAALIVLSSFTTLSILASSYNINSGFIDIHKTELQAVTHVLTETKQNVDTIYYLPAPMKLLVEKKQMKRVITDEYGRLSSPSAWVPKPMIELLSNGDKVVLPYNNQPIGDNAMLIDFGKEYLKEKNKAAH